jgi:hypothetical protein
MKGRRRGRVEIDQKFWLSNDYWVRFQLDLVEFRQTERQKQIAHELIKNDEHPKLKCRTQFQIENEREIETKSKRRTQKK